MIFELAKDFHDAVAAMPSEHPRHRMLELLEEAMRRDIHFIDGHPTTLFQCMWNTCWWYDCPDAAKHYQKAPSSRTSTKKLQQRAWARGTLCGLMEQWRNKSACPRDLTWFRSMTPPNVRLTGKPLLTLAGHESVIEDLCYSVDGHRLASCAMDGTVRLWDTITGVQLALIQASCSRVSRLAFSPDNRHVAYAVYDDRQAAVCDLETGAQLHHPHGGWVDAVAFSPNGCTVASGATAGHLVGTAEIHVWDALTGATKGVRSFPIQGSYVADVAFNHRDGILVYAVTPDFGFGAVYFYACNMATSSLQNSRLLARYEGSSDSTHFSSLAKVWTVFSPDGNYLAARWCPCSHDPRNPNVYQEGHSIRVWKWSDGNVEFLNDIAFEDRFECFAFSADGRHLLVAVGGNAIIWSCDIRTRRRVQFRSPDGEAVSAIAVSPACPGIVATGTGSETHAIHIWRPEERGTEELFGRPAAGKVQKISPSGNWVLTSQREHVHLWDTLSAHLRCSIALTAEGIAILMSVGIDQSDHLIAVALACEMDLAPFVRECVEIVGYDGKTCGTHKLLDIPCEDPTKHLITDLAFSTDRRYLFLEINSGFRTRVWNLREECEVGPPVPPEILAENHPFNHPEQVLITLKDKEGTPVRLPLVPTTGQEDLWSKETISARMIQKGREVCLLSERGPVMATIPNEMIFALCWPRRLLWINTSDGYFSIHELETGATTRPPAL